MDCSHGPALIGIFLNIFLLGIMVTQCLFYFSTYKKDALWIKLYVLLLLFMDLLNSAFDIYWIYHDIILNFGKSLTVAFDPALVVCSRVFSRHVQRLDVDMQAIIGTSCQLFFAWRVAVLTRNMWITSFIVITSIVSMLGGLGVAIAIHYVKYFQDFHKFDQVGSIWLVSTAVCDVAISGSLTWYLRKHKTGFNHTDDVLDKIIRLTVQNGAITAVWAIVDLALFLGVVTSIRRHLAFNFPLAKLYTNSLMSSLNSRSGWKFNNTDTRDAVSAAHTGGKVCVALTLMTMRRYD
ncbi:hypothetical protein BC835DRAFT_1291038 [Cytidiella melzeri]|nr:hypothetical protein BC835DRAFT_1291038 [Cytidiella melzeri]